MLALRPFVTGVALVGAGVIALAPIQPTPNDIPISRPLPQVNHEVRLAGVVDDTINGLLFTLVATPTVRGTEMLLVPIAKAILPDAVAARLPIVALGFAGPLISAPAAVATAIQAIIDGFGTDPGSGFLATLGAPATIIDGLIFGGYGPDLWPLVGKTLLAADPELAASVQVLVNILGEPPPTALAGGLLNSQEILRHILNTPVGPAAFPLQITLPGVLPVQSLVRALFGAVGIASPVAAIATGELVSANKIGTGDRRPVTRDVSSAPAGEAVVKRAPAHRTVAASPRALREAAGEIAKDVTGVLGKTPPANRPGFGPEVSDLARPASAHSRSSASGRSVAKTQSSGAGSGRGRGAAAP